MKLLYEDAKWKKVASALQNVNEAHKYDNKYEDADHLFDDSKKDISEKDVDGAITFKPQEYQPEAKPIRQDYKKLYDYAKGIGKIIDEKVDTPFYESIDGYIQKMADFNVTSYSTANTINVKEGILFKTNKKEITLNDLYEADTTYSANLKTEYEAWKLQNPSEEASKEDYRQAALNSGAFEYEGIRAGQEKKEFWFNLIAAGVVIGLSIVCPPAGLAAGAVYTAIDLAGAAKGKDLISGRKLSDEERMMRGVFAIAPGVGGLAVKSLLKNVPALANVLKTTAKTVDDAVKPLKNTIDGVKIQSKAVYSTVVSNAKKLGGQHVDQLKYALSHPVVAAVTTKAGQKTIRESAKFIDDALRPVEVRTAQTTAGNTVIAGIGRGESSGKLTGKADNYLSIKQTEKDAIKGNKGTGEVEINLGKADLDAYRAEIGVPERDTVSIGKADVKGLEGYTFKGASPKVLEDARLPSLDELYPNREIIAPYNRELPSHRQFMEHAEEGVIAEFEYAVNKAKLKPEDVEGTLYIHQSNRRGICNKCTLGLFEPDKLGRKGIFSQITEKYPNLTIKATTEIDPTLKFPRDTLSFEVKNGEVRNAVQIRKNPKNQFQFTEYPE